MIAAFRALLARIRGTWTTASREPDLREELEHDLALMIEDGEREGLTSTEARRQALLKLGGLEQTMQSVRDRRTLPALEELLQDIRFALRQFSRRPGFTFTAIVTLALGFAASIAIFAFVDAAMIKPLPFSEPQRLAWVTETVDRMGPANLSWQDYQDWIQRSHSFESFAAWRYSGGPIRVGNALLPVPGMQVSANFLNTLGLHPQLGRDFNSSDNLPGASNVLMLTDGLWRGSFGADPSIVNRTLELNGEPYSVIGVLPAGFQFAPRGRLQYLTSIVPKVGTCNGRRSCHSLSGVGRLKSGVSIAQANDDVKRIADELQIQYPDSNRGQGGVALPLTEQVVGKIRPVLYTLLSAALLLCAIACINVASLLLARSESRRREFALRSALGATHLRMVRQFAAESATLVLAAAVIGIGVGVASIHALMLLVPQTMRERMPFFDAVGLSRNTILFTLAVAVFAMALFTLVPGLRVSWRALQQAMAEGNASAGAGSLSWKRLGSLLVIAEIAVSVILLIGAGLLSRSVTNLLRTELNFNPEHLVTLGVDIPQKKFSDGTRSLAMERQLVGTLAHLPGVTSVGYGDLLPVSFNGNTDWIRFPGRPYDGKHIEINARNASPTYLQTLQVPLLKGRFISEQDTPGKPRVAIVNKTFADAYFPKENPVGKTFGSTSLAPDTMKTIVGVVADLHEGALDDPTWPTAYYAAAQNDDGMALVLRVAGDESSTIAALPRTVRSVDADLTTNDIMTMTDRINSSQSATLRRGAAWLAGTFAAVALLLCAVGLYGVISYSVSLRSREIGVRMALGARRESIYGMVLGEAGRLSATGIVLGIVLSAICMSLLQAVLFHVSRWDWPTLTAACLILLLCSLAASLAPARKAASSSPMEALRTD